MASYYMIMKNEKEFYERLKEREWDLVYKMVKSVLFAYKRKRESIDIFEITFKDLSTFTFNITKDQYKELIKNCWDDFIYNEEYEMLCSMRDIINEKDKKVKVKLPINELLPK